MSEVKWIKITSDIFENRKIRQIESLPDGDAVIVIWLKLLCLAGQINDRGAVYLTREIPYTEEMMATQFKRPLKTIKLALEVFQQFGMIEIVDDILQISNWEKYQNTDGLDRIREQNRIRKQQQRERDRLRVTDDLSRDSHVTVTPCHALDIDIDKDIDKDIDIDRDIEREEERDGAQSAPPPARKPTRHRFGQYQNVLLTEEDLGKLQSEFPGDWQKRIESLSAYMKSTGKSYKDHLATIRNWARRDQERGITQGQRQTQTTSKAQELEAFYNQTAAWAEQEDK